MKEALLETVPKRRGPDDSVLLVDEVECLVSR
jgi:hypothetical protein